MRLARISPLIVFATALLFLAFFAHADSVVWNSTQIVRLCGLGTIAGNLDYTQDCINILENPNVSIEYRADVVNAATGQSVCNATVPVGTKLSIVSNHQSFTDISWFGTGSSLDSPYGQWVTASQSPTLECTDANYVASNYFCTGVYQRCSPPGYLFRFFSSLFVQKPVVTTNNSGGLKCSGDSCVAAQAGDQNVTFNYAPTSGDFYARYDRGAGSSCIGVNIPMKRITHSASPVGAFKVNGIPAEYAPYVSASNPSTWPAGVYYSPDDGNPADDTDFISFMTTPDNTAPYSLQVPAQKIECPFTVVAANGNAPTTPQLTSGGACVVGSAQNISMTSTDPDGDQLRYGIDWNSDGSIDQWVPAPGYAPSGTSQSASRSYAIAGSKTVKVLAQDKNGNSSSWATLSFSCAGSTTAGLDEAGTNDGSGDGGGGSLQLLPDLDLRVIPSLVRSGNTTKVNWSASNVSSCTVTGQNGDSWSSLQSILGGNVSKPITGETTYTLSCLDLEGATRTKTATVRIIPVFQEK